MTENLIFKTETIKLYAMAKNINELVKEFKIQVLSEGLRIMEIDPANVCLIDVVLNKEEMPVYNYEKKAVYCLNAEDFYKILKDNKKTDVNFYIDEERKKAVFGFSNGSKSELPLIDSDSDIKPIPELDFKGKIEIEAKKFKEIIKNLSNIGESVKIDFNSEENYLIFSAKEGENKTEIKLNSDEVLINGTAKSIYSLEYLSKMIKEQIGEKVILCLNSDRPLMVRYEASKYFKINFLLAPRINEE